MPIKVEIVTQERTVYEGHVDSVNLPGSEGRLGILPNHSPLLTTLLYGEVIVSKDGQEDYYAVGGGFAEVQPEKVIILADSVEHSDEIDLERAQRARTRAKKMMEEGVPEDMERFTQIQASLQRAQVRINVAQRRHRTSALPTELRSADDKS
ncbi:MAG: ATP synthase F1 subunit epsilon [Chloroflexi bacterium]|nr:MAG: ATP synthase F1 subunit epsilon [Chloroflexota bacterium]